MLLDDVNDVLRRISRAALSVGRSPAEVRLVAVTKTVSTALMREAIEAGIRAFGENRVQEAAAKIDHFRGMPKLQWHLLGTLQKNKVKKAVELFDLIESIDSEDLAGLVDRHAAEIGKIQRVFLQVRLGEEATKHGVDPGDVERIAGRISGLPNLRLEGLMAVPPFAAEPEDVRPYFRELRGLRDRIAKDHRGVRELSMGMSNDFEIAVEEGATEVRVGTRIFGGRQ